MDEQVRNQLTDLLASSGRNICTMPRMLGILLRQRCPHGEEQVRALELALECGCVRPILAATSPVDEPALAEQLAAQAELDADRARWAIAAWVQALDAADTPAAETVGRDWSSWNRLDVSAETAGGTGSFSRSVWHLGIVGVAGALGGSSLGFFLLGRGDEALIEPWRVALEDLAPWLQVFALLALGGLGGFAGGLLGWIFGGGRSWTYDAFGGTTAGRLMFSALGALNGAGIGVLCCLGLLGLIGALIGSLIGAALGAFLGLLSAERIARYWAWW